MVSTSHDRTLRVWRLSDGACMRTIEGHVRTIKRLMWSVVDVGGGRMASGGVGGTLRVWDALSGQQLQQISTAREGREDEDIYCMAALPGGRVATGLSHGQIRLWRLGEDGGAAGVLVGHAGAVNGLVLLGGGRAQPMLASASDDGTVRLWDLDAGTCAAVLDGHGDELYPLADMGGGRLLSVLFRALCVWDVGAAACLTTVEVDDGEGSDVSSVCAMADGRIASGEDGGLLRIWAWDEASKALTQEGEPLAGHTDIVEVVVAVGAGAAQQLLSGSGDCTLRLWSRGVSGAWAETAVLRGHTGRVLSIAAVRARQPNAPCYCASGATLQASSDRPACS